MNIVSHTHKVLAKNATMLKEKENHALWEMDGALLVDAVLICAWLYQGPQCLRPMEIAKPSAGKVQRCGKAFL